MGVLRSEDCRPCVELVDMLAWLASLDIDVTEEGKGGGGIEGGGDNEAT